MDTAAKRPGPHGRAATPRTTMYPDTREALRDFKTRKSYPLPMIMILARTTRLRGFQLDRTDFAEGHKFSIAASQYLCELIVKSTVGVYILISLIGQRSQCWRQERRRREGGRKSFRPSSALAFRGGPCHSCHSFPPQPVASLALTPPYILHEPRTPRCIGFPLSWNDNSQASSCAAANAAINSELKEAHVQRHPFTQTEFDARIYLTLSLPPGSILRNQVSVNERKIEGRS
jgi:hypothetical protein